MTAVAAPFGFRPAYHPSGLIRQAPYTIASGYAVNLFKGDPVKLVTAGTIQLATSDGTRTGTVDGIEVLGVFAGVEYIDASGKPTVSNMWPTGTVATNIRAYVWTDKEIVFEVQATATLTQAAIGDQCDFGGFSAPGGSTSTGISSASLNASTIVGAGQQGQFSIQGFGLGPDNAVGDAYPIVQVTVAEHVYAAPFVAI